MGYGRPQTKLRCTPKVLFFIYTRVVQGNPRCYIPISEVYYRVYIICWELLCGRLIGLPDDIFAAPGPRLLPSSGFRRARLLPAGEAEGWKE